MNKKVDESKEKVDAYLKAMGNANAGMTKKSKSTTTSKTKKK